MYYGSYRSPRTLAWSIGVIIFILMMAKLNLWPNCEYDYTNVVYCNCIIGKMLPFNKHRTKALNRIGPHNKQILDIIICGMLGEFWADKITGKQLDSIRFNIEQSISNSAYIHHITLLFYKLGYCARPIPTLIKKSDKIRENRFNYKLSLFTFTSFIWIYDSYYICVAPGLTQKRVPIFISDYLTPIGLAHWIMQDGSFQRGQGLNIATNSFSYEECKFLANILTNKYNLKTSVVKTGAPAQWRISIWKESLPILSKIVSPYFIPEMVYKLKGRV
jgi:ubiquinol-cytochrome c reductase cytochrome b subunit